MNNLSNYVMKFLESSKDTHTIPIYSGVYHLAVYFDNNGFEPDRLIKTLSNTIANAKFYEPNKKPSTIARTFAHLLMMDVMLLELYLGFNLSELDGE